MKTTKPQAVELLLSDARGIYIPRDFCNDYDMDAWSLTALVEDVEICKEGPDHEFYWEAWEVILNNAKNKEFGHTLHQDGDLFALNPSMMSREEKKQWDIELDASDYEKLAQE